MGPSEFYALNLGSVGLALKMIILQFFLVNVQLYFNSKFLKINFFHFLFHQFSVIIILVAIAYISNFFSSTISNFLISFFTQSVIYLFSIMLIIYNYPKLIGLNSRSITKYKTLILKKIY